MKVITMNVAVDSEDTYVEVMKTILENINNQIKILEGEPIPQKEFQLILSIRGGKNGCTFGSNLFNIPWIATHLSISKKDTHIIFVQFEDGVDVYVTYYKQDRVDPKVWKVIQLIENKFKKENEGLPVDMYEGVGGSLVYYANHSTYLHNQILLRNDIVL